MLALALLTGSTLWVVSPSGIGAQMVHNLGLDAGVLAFSMDFAAALNPHWAPGLAPSYALEVGVFVAGLARALEFRFQGIVFQSAAITLAVLLLLYQRGWLRAMPRLLLAVYTATGAIALVYLLAMLVALWWYSISCSTDGGWCAVLVCCAVLCCAVLWFAFVAITAALNLVLDFERIHQTMQRPLPAYMVWYLALGLMVSLVWLYVSFLRLLASVRR